MGLRKKILLAIILIFGMMIFINYIVVNFILLENFQTIEKGDVNQKVKQAEGALFEELNRIKSVAFDYGYWEETYNFVNDGNVDYIKTNIGDTFFTNLKVNLAVYVNLSGQVVFSKAFDLSENKEIPVPTSFFEHIQAGNQLLEHADVNDSLCTTQV